MSKLSSPLVGVPSIGSPNRGMAVSVHGMSLGRQAPQQYIRGRIMMLSRRSRAAGLVVALAMGMAGVRQAFAFDVVWLPVGTSGWNTGANWADMGSPTTRDAIPSAINQEMGVINNGGTATLAAPIGEATGGVTLGQAAADTGTLSITSGGVFTSVVSGSTTGVVTVGAAGRGTLNVSGTGQLTAPGLNIGGLATSQANFSNTAAITISGNSTVSRGLRITGPGVNFSSTGGVTFNGASVYTPEITAGTHSPVKASAPVALGGTLAVQFTGVTPAVGNSWNLVDATAINGNFANAAIGRDFAVTGAATPAVGSAFRLRRVAGGTNGQLLQVALESMLVMRVNRDTGEMTLRNPVGAAVTQLSGYSVTSPRGSMLSTYKGISGAPVGNAGWEKATTNSTTGLAEFKPTGVFDVSSAATSVTLGTGFSKSAYATAQGINGLGNNGEDLTFDYTTLSGVVVRGQVEYVGAPFLNNMLLNVTSTGVATLKNDTLLSIAIDGYSIVSSTNSLLGAGWTSLEDRTATRFDGWQKSPAAAGALSETNSLETNMLTLAPGESLSLGDIGNFPTALEQGGLSFKYIVGSETSSRTARVQFLTSPAGDYDGDLDVDGNDFLVWQRGGSPNPNSPADLATWKANYGTVVSAAAATGAASAVPEPAAMALLAIGLAAGMGARPLRRRASAARPATGMNVSGDAISSTHENIMTSYAKRSPTSALWAVVLLLVASTGAQAATTMSFGVDEPTVGPIDQAQLINDALIPGGNAPGDGVTLGGAYNGQAYSDNNGPPGQTFTSPTGSYVYGISSLSLKGASIGSPNAGGGVFDAGATWSIRISSLSGTTLTPIKVVSAIPTVVNLTPDPTALDGDEWYTWTFGVGDVPLLNPSSTYAFDIYSSTGYLGFGASVSDASYPGGTAFNSGGGAVRSFAGTTTGNLANHVYDRTFHLALSQPAPGSIAGDANGNGAANIADYVLIRDNLEKSVTRWTNGDLNGDAYVDLTDFRKWTLAVPPEVAALAGVPEPSTAVLLISGTLFAGARARRRSIRDETSAS